MVFLHGMGHYFPENRITNSFIQELDIGSSEEWIMQRVGIKTRHTTLCLDYIRMTRNKNKQEALAASTQTHGQMGAEASRMAMKRADITPQDIGMVICGTSSPSHAIPAMATMVAADLNIDVSCLDINSACSSFGVQLSMIHKMSPENTPAYILIVNPECCTHEVDYSDRRVAPLFGDGCSAAVVSLKEFSHFQFKDAQFQSNPLNWEKIKIPRMGHFSQEGKAVQKFAIRKTMDALNGLKNTYSNAEEMFFFIGHQANLMVLNHVCRECHIKEQNHWYNVVDYGNTGCASAPSVLSQKWDKLTPGTFVAMVVVGSGLTWAHAMLEVTDKRA